MGGYRGMSVDIGTNTVIMFPYQYEDVISQVDIC